MVDLTRKRRRILVVDDDQLVRSTVASGLHHAGYDVYDAGTGEDGLELAVEREPHLALLDVRLPGMSGIELARRLREETRVPFMFLSAYGDAILVAEAVKLGGLGYLVKPLVVSQIVPAIEAALARAAEIREVKAVASQLEIALTEKREIGIAVGMISVRLGIGPTDAFLRLRQFARSRRRKIADIAADIVEGAMDPSEVKGR